jgi:hypothetical protein
MIWEEPSSRAATELHQSCTRAATELQQSWWYERRRSERRRRQLPARAGRQGYFSTALFCGGAELHACTCSLLPAQSWWHVRSAPPELQQSCNRAASKLQQYVRSAWGGGGDQNYALNQEGTRRVQKIEIRKLRSCISVGINLSCCFVCLLRGNGMDAVRLQLLSCVCYSCLRLPAALGYLWGYSCSAASATAAFSADTCSGMRTHI